MQGGRNEEMAIFAGGGPLAERGIC